MAAEAIKKIKEAEDKAQARLADAAEQAKQIGRTAQKESADKHRSILADAKRQREEIIKQARSEAETECAPLAEDGRAGIERIKSPAPEKFDEAVNKVIERIVRPLDRRNE